MLFQVRVPGLGELGVVCLLAAQWVCTSPPFGYLTNTGSPKGFWQSWQSFLSESQTALPFSFTCKQKAIVRKLLSQGGWMYSLQGATTAHRIAPRQLLDMELEK